MPGKYNKAVKDKKTLIFIIISIVLLFGVFFSQSPFFIPKKQPEKNSPVEALLNTAQLESQIQRFKDLIRAFVELNQKLQAAFIREKKERGTLEKMLKDTTLDNKILSKSLLQFKAGLDLTEPLKEKIREIESDLSSLPLKVEEEKELKKFLWEIKGKLNDLDSQIPIALKENRAYKIQAERLNTLLSQKDTEITLLKTQKNSLAGTVTEFEKTLKMHAPLENKVVNLEKINSELKQTNYILAQEIGHLKEKQQAKEDTLSRYQKASEELEAIKRKEIEQSNTILSLTGKNQAMAFELESLHKQLASWEQQRQGLIEELKDSKNTIQNNVKLHEIIDQLKTQLEEITKRYAALEKELRLAQKTIKNNDIELGKRAEKILLAQEKRQDAENKTAQFQVKAQELEKDSTSLREQIVSVQLEREALRNQLLEAQGRLGELEIKASQITNILKTPKAAETSLSSPEKKDIALDLYPLQNNTATASGENKESAPEEKAGKEKNE